jgi:hypothetical protein
MARMKLYEYNGKRCKAYNKEQVRRRYNVPYRKVKHIRLVWCKAMGIDCPVV